MPYWRLKFRPNVGFPLEVTQVTTRQAHRPHYHKGITEWTCLLMAPDEETAVERACEKLQLKRIKSRYERLDDL